MVVELLYFFIHLRSYVLCVLPQCTTPFSAVHFAVYIYVLLSIVYLVSVLFGMARSLRRKFPLVSVECKRLSLLLTEEEQ
jgi:hypothetical protein